MPSRAADFPKRQMQVLSLGLFRTGTYSMSQALTTLSYADVYRGLNSLGKNDDWIILGNAADPFTRDEWDQIWGSCEAVTDVASAKVVLVKRDYDKWCKSVNETIIDSLWGVLPNFFVGAVEPLIGSVSGLTSRKMLLGWAAARDEKELRANLRAACWEPLYEFLGREVPRGEDGKPVPFPHANEAAALRRKIMEQQVGTATAVGVGLWLARGRG
ncbi:hypothetical protein B0T18DRAFT_481375 [Schizothecium vesticola]|uniref:Uncharacterized protein n=1 Tax=Schizothecium vesticola TaxID=314040 RepID=A0AA40K240_9PEZI|nr:hypothetical protein B0T18DRAFT_481375 [Schizothecium vesticola]